MSSQTKNNVNESLFITGRDKVSNNIEVVASPNNFQVGLEKSPADTTLRGRFSINAKTYTASKANDWTIRIDEDTTLASIEISTSDAATAFSINRTITVYLPPKPRTGQFVTVKDFSGTAGKVNIRIYDPSFAKIDGENYRVINTYYDSLEFWWQGTKWICSKGQTKYYANLYDTSIQTLTSSLSAQELQILSVSDSYGITLSNVGKINFNSTGTYQVIFSLQFQNTDNTAHEAYVWFRFNGTDIANSNSRIDIAARKSANVYGYSILTVPFIISADANDYLQIYWNSDSTLVTVHTFPTGSTPVFPVTPGVIVTAQQI